MAKTPSAFGEGTSAQSGLGPPPRTLRQTLDNEAIVVSIEVKPDTLAQNVNHRFENKEPAMIYVFCAVAGLGVGFLLGIWAGINFAGMQIRDDREQEGPM